MTQMPDQNQSLLPGQAGHNPMQVAMTLGVKVRSLVVGVFWIVVAAAVLAFGYVALAAIWLAAQIVLKAIGLNGG